MTDQPAPSALPLPEERALVLRAQAGDPAAFDVLVRQHLARAVRVAQRVTQSRDDAEDVVQDAFVSAYRALGTFDAARPFTPWLYRIVMNAALSHQRSWRSRRLEALTAELPSTQPSPAEDMEQAELRTRLVAAVAALPERQRTIIQLFEVDGFSSREIGEMLGVAEGTVRWHVHAARQALRAALASPGTEEGGTNG